MIRTVRRELAAIRSGLYHCATCQDDRTVRLVPDSGTYSAAGPGDDPCPDCNRNGREWVDCPHCGLANGVPTTGHGTCLGCAAQCCDGCGEVTLDCREYGHDVLCGECLGEEGDTIPAPPPVDAMGVEGAA